jgi:hypothetical protein
MNRCCKSSMWTYQRPAATRSLHQIRHWKFQACSGSAHFIDILRLRHFLPPLLCRFFLLSNNRPATTF